MSHVSPGNVRDSSAKGSRGERHGSATGAFVAVSLALHGAVFGAAVGGPRLLELLHLRHPQSGPSAVLTGGSFVPATSDDLVVDAPESAPGDPGHASEATPASAAAQAPGATEKPVAADGMEKAVAPRHGGKPNQGQKQAASSAPPTSGENGAAGEAALYGAVGERSATDLPLAFTRAFPQASSPDPSWANAQLGAAGEADVTITLDESGHIESVAVNCPNGSLASGISRTMSLLRARPFTARRKSTHLHLSARISPDQVHDGLHGDVFAIGQSDGNAFFALSIGRRIDVKISVR